MTRPLRDLRRNEDGISAVEFAFVGPVFLLMLVGLFDLGFQMYANSVLQGSLQQAARASTLEDGSVNMSVLDGEVQAIVQDVIPGANVALTRRNYANFSDIRMPEAWTDFDGDGICNNGEPFEDLNGNANWDRDRGRGGLGGARDAVLYTATATYDRMFPLASFVGLDEKVTLQASSVLRNQPYNEQGLREPTAESCT